MTSDEPRYDVVWPLAPVIDGAGATKRASRREDLSGARIGFVWDYVFNGDVIFEEIRRHLDERYEDVTYVDYPTFGNIHGHDEEEVVERLPELLLTTEVDSVIIGVGA